MAIARFWSLHRSRERGGFVFGCLPTPKCWTEEVSVLCHSSVRFLTLFISKLVTDSRVVGGVRVTVSSDIGCVSVLIIQCTRAGFVMTVDGQLVHRAGECPYQMDATDTVVHSWGGRRDAFCMEGDDFLEQPQHADLVGFLQREALDRNDTLCWKGSTADGKKAASRFFALPVDSVDEDLGAAGEWGVAVKEVTPLSVCRVGGARVCCV